MRSIMSKLLRWFSVAPVEKAWSSSYINSLPDSSFLYVESDGTRHLPVKDADGNVDKAHLDNAISRLSQENTGTGKDAWLTESLREKLLAKAKKMQASLKKADADDAATDATVEAMVEAVVKAYHAALAEYDCESGKAFSLYPIADMDGDQDGEGQMLWCVSDCYASWYILAKGGSADLIAWYSMMTNGDYASDSLYCREDVADVIAKNELPTGTEDERAVALVRFLEERDAPAPADVYKVLKADDSQRYTLGVAYPADEIDKHGDFTSPDELEQSAWNFMRSVVAKGAGGVGTDHADGTDDAAHVVESYIYRGPLWKTEDGAVIAKEGDWLVGAIWTEDGWERIQKGDLTGWSIQGLAYRNDEAEAPGDGDA